MSTKRWLYPAAGGLTTTCLGVAINLATELRTNPWTWVAVAGLTVAGVVVGAGAEKLNRARSAANPVINRSIMTAVSGKRNRVKVSIAGPWTIIATGVVVIVAVVAGLLSGLSAGRASSAANEEPVLRVSDLEVTTKEDVTATDSDAGKETGTRPVDVAAASIVLRNSGEEAAYINRLQVNINQVWIPPGCEGGGPLATSVAYDFILPGDLEMVPRPVPIVMTKKVQFKVDGHTVDSLAVTIGQETIGEVRWPWITAATVELIQDNGDRAKTEQFVLMDGDRVDGIVKGVAFQLDHNPASTEFKDCMDKAIDVLEEALDAPGKKSSALSELHDRLTRLGFGRQPSVTTSPRPGDDATDTWIAQLASLPQSTSASDVERTRVEIAQQTGLEVRVLNSSDFASLTPGYWVIYSPGDFTDGYEALEQCKEHGRVGEQLCVGRYLSHTEQDQDFICRFSDDAESRRCARN